MSEEIKPCPKCGAEAVAIDTLSGIMYHCRNVCKQDESGAISFLHADWNALPRDEKPADELEAMPTPKKTAVVWIQNDNGITYVNTGKKATVDISNPKMSGDLVCRFGEYWCYAGSIEEAYKHIEDFRLDKPTPERPFQTWTTSDPAAVIKPDVVIGDPVTAPEWYTWHPVAECRDITAFFPFHLGNAIKYIWRAGKKVDELTDLLKAKEEIDNQIRANKIAADKLGAFDFDAMDDDDGEKDEEDGNAK